MLVIVASAYIDFHFLPQVKTDFSQQVVTHIIVLRHNTVGSHVCIREIRRDIVVTTSQGDRVVGSETRSVKFFCIIRSFRRQLVTPAKSTFITHTIRVLELRQRHRRFNCRIARYIDRHLTCLSRFGCNHNSTIGSNSTIQCSSRSTFQQSDLSNIVRVDRRHGIATITLATIYHIYLRGRYIHHQRHAIHNYQRLVATANRFITTEQNL